MEETKGISRTRKQVEKSKMSSTGTQCLPDAEHSKRCEKCLLKQAWLILYFRAPQMFWSINLSSCSIGHKSKTDGWHGPHSCPRHPWKPSQLFPHYIVKLRPTITMRDDEALDSISPRDGHMPGDQVACYAVYVPVQCLSESSVL